MATEGSSVPPGSKGSWASFLKSITSFSGDLSSLTAPPFILSGVSLVEYSSYWAEHPSLFVAPAKEKDPAKRALAVLTWFISTLKQQYSSRNEHLGSEKKPLNPFLGELFLGRWQDEAGTTQLVSEQVCHHPPVTAYCIWNGEHGVRLQGYNGQKASISKALTIHIKQIGHALLHIDEFNEDYLITLPSLHIEGVYGGAPYVELNKSSFIQSSSGYTAKIDYSGKGWLSGKKNSFTATLYHEGREKDPLYTIDGQWTGSFSTKEGKSKNVIASYDPAKHPLTKLVVASIEEQDEMESRRAWQKVAHAISKGDMDTTSAEKSRIENEQRALRVKEKEDGREWNRFFFTRAKSDPVLDALAPKLGEIIESDKTDGVWLWDAEKAKNSKPPFKNRS
ncbi:Oxysterol-binding protein [Tothia fuscella]|uniref:Oxysterol-binding protein n=1 Tax=Tothia fuscella TaxID=1048955 RepID=A0A9P4TVX1_9PEZI|nr:Oxysterol-binding protein [Tothia fuscella]